MTGPPTPLFRPLVAAGGAVYMTLERLEEKGLLTSHLTDPTPERGGRSKRVYAVTATALVALRDSRRALMRMWDDIEAALEGGA
jgi:DNA-binding PadR family transcriptional regulator